DRVDLAPHDHDHLHMMVLEYRCLDLRLPGFHFTNRWRLIIRTVRTLPAPQSHYAPGTDDRSLSTVRGGVRSGHREPPVGAQPRCGATSVAIRSMERSTSWCGGSMECTWKERWVARASAVSAARVTRTSSGSPVWASVAASSVASGTSAGSAPRALATNGARRSPAVASVRAWSPSSATNTDRATLIRAGTPAGRCSR